MCTFRMMLNIKTVVNLYTSPIVIVVRDYDSWFA